jgi:hypothetical protein
MPVIQHAIHAALKVDQTAQTVQAQLGESVVAKLAEGNVHDAFFHLKGSYWSATETQAQPCFQTMEKQTIELLVDLCNDVTHQFPQLLSTSTP